jgi:hypothetical protein
MPQRFAHASTIRKPRPAPPGPGCAEVAISPAHRPTIHIRDSKNKDAARLAFTDDAWSEFLAFTAGH